MEHATRSFASQRTHYSLLAPVLLTVGLSSWLRYEHILNFLAVPFHLSTVITGGLAVYGATRLVMRQNKLWKRVVTASIFVVNTCCFVLGFLLGAMEGIALTMLLGGVIGAGLGVRDHFKSVKELEQADKKATKCTARGRSESWRSESRRSESRRSDRT